MQLLGSYKSLLTSWYYQGLLDMLKQSIQLGDYSGSATLDTTILQKLVNDAQDFSNLPALSAGQRVTDDVLNQSLQLLAIRFASLAQETSDFNSKVAALISVLEKDTVLLDQILATAYLEGWVKAQPQVGGAQTVQWDFSAGQGKTSKDIANIDPSNNVTYPNAASIGTYLYINDGLIHSGLVPNASIRSIPTKNLTWTFNTQSAEVENLIGEDWAELSLLETSPLVSYNIINTVVITPADVDISKYIQISGSAINGTVPTYIRILYTPRQAEQTFNGIQDTRKMVNGTPITLSKYGYKFALDGVSVFAGPEFYQEGQDYSLDSDKGTITPINIDTTTQITVRFTEMYPAYECSVNELNWSSLLMLDPDNPYMDSEQEFAPIAWGPNKELPITDEEGNPTGLYINLIDALPYESYLQVSTLPNPDCGALAALEIEFEHSSFITGLNLAPYTTFPISLRKVELIGFTGTKTVFIGSTVLDRNLTIAFDRQLVNKIRLTFYQQNYTFKTYSVDPVDKLRRDTMIQVQPILPYNIRRTDPPVSFNYSGCLYEFGIENILAVDVSTNTPTVFVSGPFRFNGIPEILRLDTNIYGTVDTYLCYVASDGNGNIKDEVGLDLQGGTIISSGVSQCFPLTVNLSSDIRKSIDHTDVWVKFVLRSTDSIVERFLMQVISHVQ